MTPIAASIASEWSKLWSVRSTWWCLIGAVVLMALYSVPLGLDASAPNPDLPRAQQLVHAEDVATAGLLFTQFALITLALLTVTSEYASGSMRTTLQCDPQRGRVLLSKLVVVVVVALLAGALLGVLGAWLGHLAAGEYGVFEVSAVAVVAAKIAAYVGVATAMSIGVAMALRSTAGTLVTVFMALFLVPIVFMMSGVDVMIDIAYYLPGTAGTEFLGVGIATIFGLGDAVPYSRTGGFAVLLAWLAVALAAGYAVLRRRDA